MEIAPMPNESPVTGDGASEAHLFGGILAPAQRGWHLWGREERRDACCSAAAARAGAAQGGGRQEWVYIAGSEVDKDHQTNSPVSYL